MQKFILTKMKFEYGNQLLQTKLSYHYMIITVIFTGIYKLITAILLDVFIAHNSNK
jgi:hypothetical protein